MLISWGRAGPDTGSPAISAAPQVWLQWNQITREAPLSPRPRWHVLKGFGNPVRFMNESLRSLAVIRSAVVDGSLRPPGDTRAGQPAPALGLAPWQGGGPFAECPGPLEPRRLQAFPSTPSGQTALCGRRRAGTWWVSHLQAENEPILKARIPAVKTATSEVLQAASFWRGYATGASLPVTRAQALSGTVRGLLGQQRAQRQPGIFSFALSREGLATPTSPFTPLDLCPGLRFNPATSGSQLGAVLVSPSGHRCAHEGPRSGS